MIYHKDERFMDIIKKSGTTDIFPAARYIMQLESIKEAASILVNKVSNVEFPFKYTGTDRPEDAVFGAEYLVRAIAEEQIQAEERFREMLVKVFKITRDMQEKEFGEYLDVDYFDAYKIIKDLKHKIFTDPMEESDEEILEKIIFTVDLSCWFDSFDEEDEEDYEGEDHTGRYVRFLHQSGSADQPGAGDERLAIHRAREKGRRALRPGRRAVHGSESHEGQLRARHDLRRRDAGDDHLPGGDLRAGWLRDPVRYRGGGDPPRERHRIRPRGRGVRGGRVRLLAHGGGNAARRAGKDPAGLPAGLLPLGADDAETQQEGSRIDAQNDSLLVHNAAKVQKTMEIFGNHGNIRIFAVPIFEIAAELSARPAPEAGAYG